MKQEKLNLSEHRLYRLLASLHTPHEVQALLEDLCTFREVEQMAQRIDCAKLLLEGGTYQSIISQTDISSATLSRVSRCIRHGSGGYTKLLATFLEQEEKDESIQ